MIDIKGKWALITGASRGIGREAALFLAGQGCNLILHSRKLENTQRVEAEAKERGVVVIRAAAELTDEKQVRSMLQTIDGTGVAVDIVLNNAGLQIAYRNDYFNTPVSDFETSFMVNTIAPALICYHFLPKMMARGFGRIVNTTSGIQNEPEQAGYSASKAALDKITVDMGSKLQGTDVMINLTDPGWCRTDLGGPSAPNDVKSTIPGVVIGAFLKDRKSGRIIEAQNYAGMSLEAAVEKVQAG